MHNGNPVNGTWNLVISAPRGERRATLGITADGPAVTGTVNSTAIEEATWSDGELTFSARLTEPFQVTLRCTMTVDSDTMTGNARAAMLPVPIPVSGTRAQA
jgi:hypothetical protein